MLHLVEALKLDRLGRETGSTLHGLVGRVC